MEISQRRSPLRAVKASVRAVPRSENRKAARAPLRRMTAGASSAPSR